MAVAMKSSTWHERTSSAEEQAVGIEIGAGHV